MDSLTVEEIFGESFLQTAAEKEKEGEKKEWKTGRSWRKMKKLKRETSNYFATIHENIPL